MKEWDTKDEAYNRIQALEYAKNINIREQELFCPLINNTCLKNCVCWKEAYAEKGGRKSWRVFGPYCDNGMFSKPPQPRYYV